MRVLLEIVCDINEQAAQATDLQVTEWVEYQLGLSSGLDHNNPMCLQTVHLLHPDNLTTLTIQKP